ncbi:type 1 fimbrial protein [Enterobacter mori]|uniref:Type 1 fimbrial protein n=1 Tax=Enterobacter mori TaxID=539813 RepID=A0A7T0DUD7_9ENTR|nr:fimbrial protein [Enterobacter mori]QPJ99573.1 type 1 fimbrial protein [Enterobacter mori]
MNKRAASLRKRRAAVLFMTVLVLLFPAIVTAADNLQIDGTLVNEPCELAPESENLTVEFDTIITKYLYINTRTHAIPLTIKLINCDTTIGESGWITFTGLENEALPGLLSVTGAATGIAVGMELPDGTPLTVNQPSPAFSLLDDATDIVLQAYIQGEPEAIEKGTITPGDFLATATFEIEYP